MARILDQISSKTATLLGCSRSAVVRCYQKWFKEGTLMNCNRVFGSQGTLMNVESEN